MNEFSVCSKQYTCTCTTCVLIDNCSLKVCMTVDLVRNLCTHVMIIRINIVFLLLLSWKERRSHEEPQWILLYCAVFIIHHTVFWIYLRTPFNFHSLLIAIITVYKRYNFLRGVFPCYQECTELFDGIQYCDRALPVTEHSNPAARCKWRLFFLSERRKSSERESHCDLMEEPLVMAIPSL